MLTFVITNSGLKRCHFSKSLEIYETSNANSIITVHFTDYEVCDHEIDDEDVVSTLDLLAMYRDTCYHQDGAWFVEVLVWFVEVLVNIYLKY